MKAALLNRILLVLAFAGLFVAGVLTLGHLLDMSVPCGSAAGCEVVANHPASKLVGIPVAYFGFLAYLAIVVVTSIRLLRGMVNSEKLVLLGYGLAAIGTVFSLYLQYQSFFVIHAFCPWCFTSAVIMVFLLIGHAFLAQMIERGVSEPQKSGFDSILLMGLPIVFVLAVAMQGMAMKQSGKPADSKMAALQAKLNPEVIKSLLAGNPNSLGPDDAKLTIIEFADLQCGACQSKSPMVKEFALQFPKTVKFVFHHFPLTGKHEWAMPSAAVAEYAAEKGKFWDLTMAVMGLNKELTSAEELYGIATQVGLDRADLEKRMTDPQDKAYLKVQEDLKMGNSIGIQYTPTFILVQDGKLLDVATSGDIFDILQSEKYKKIYNGG